MLTYDKLNTHKNLFKVSYLKDSNRFQIIRNQIVFISNSKLYLKVPGSVKLEEYDTTNFLISNNFVENIDINNLEFVMKHFTEKSFYAFSIDNVSWEILEKKKKKPLNLNNTGDVLEKEIRELTNAYNLYNDFVNALKYPEKILDKIKAWETKNQNLSRDFDLKRTDFSFVKEYANKLEYLTKKMIEEKESELSNLNKEPDEADSMIAMSFLTLDGGMKNVRD